MIRTTHLARGGTITRSEMAGIAYLTAPAALFLITYLRPQAWAPLIVFVAIGLWRISRLVDPTPGHRDIRFSAYLWSVAAITVFASGSLGYIHANSDWSKHFAIFRFILDNDSLIGSGAGYDGGTLRYYLGWYVVPGLLAKATTGHALLAMVGVWTILGLYIFFSITAGLTDRAGWRYALPLAFLLFSGADVVGTALTGFANGPLYHIEWWAGWIEYSSNYTDIIWAPQHALPAWIGVALALRLAQNPSSIIVIPLVTAVITLWSPFATIGLTPFYCFLLWRHRRHVSVEAGINALLMLCLTYVFFRYLTAGTDSISLKPAWELRCLGQGPCYSFSGYLIFVALEVLPTIILCIVGTRGREPLVWIAAAFLLGMPFLQFGAFNDINLHGSLPAIALIALVAWRVLPTASRRFRIAFAIVMLVGVVTPIQEMRRAFQAHEGPGTDTTFAYVLDRVPELRSQYFVDKSIWFLRKPKKNLVETSSKAAGSLD